MKFGNRQIICLQHAKILGKKSLLKLNPPVNPHVVLLMPLPNPKPLVVRWRLRAYLYPIRHLLRILPTTYQFCALHVTQKVQVYYNCVKMCDALNASIAALDDDDAFANRTSYSSRSSVHWRFLTLILRLLGVWRWLVVV